MPATALTLDGEHWDEIALRIYGAEKHLDFLLARNLPLAEVYRFAAGVTVDTPAIPEESLNIPPWRR